MKTLAKQFTGGQRKYPHVRKGDVLLTLLLVCLAQPSSAQSQPGSGSWTTAPASNGPAAKSWAQSPPGTFLNQSAPSGMPGRPDQSQQQQLQNNSGQLGQSQWQQPASDSGQLGQSQWQPPGNNSGQLGQPQWQPPGNNSGQLGQSQWQQPGNNSGQLGQPQWQPPGNNSGQLGQSQWQPPGNNSGQLGQSQWQPPGNNSGQLGQPQWQPPANNSGQLGQPQWQPPANNSGQLGQSQWQQPANNSGQLGQSQWQQPANNSGQLGQPQWQQPASNLGQVDQSQLQQSANDSQSQPMQNNSNQPGLSEWQQPDNNSEPMGQSQEQQPVTDQTADSTAQPTTGPFKNSGQLGSRSPLLGEVLKQQQLNAPASDTISLDQSSSLSGAAADAMNTPVGNMAAGALSAFGLGQGTGQQLTPQQIQQMIPGVLNFFSNVMPTPGNTINLPGGAPGFGGFPHFGSHLGSTGTVRRNNQAPNSPGLNRVINNMMRRGGVPGMNQMRF